MSDLTPDTLRTWAIEWLSGVERDIVLGYVDAWEADIEGAVCVGNVADALADEVGNLRQRLEADRTKRHMDAAHFLSQIAAWKASCIDAERRASTLRQRLEEAGKVQRAIHGDACLKCGGTDWVCADELDAIVAR